MKYFRYGFFSVIKKPLFNILIVLELAGIFIVGNLTIAASNSRSVYYDPYAEIMNSEGYVFTPRKNRNSEYDKDLRVKAAYDNLDGITTVCNYYHTLYTDYEKFNNPMFPQDYYSKNVVAFDNRIYEKFNLPLEKGRWASCQKNNSGQIEAVAIRNSDKIDIGDVIPFYQAVVNDDEPNNIRYEKVFDIVIVGIIANNTYCPGINLAINQEQNVLGCYELQMTSSDSSYFVACGADKHLIDDHLLGISTAYMIYDENYSESKDSANREKLSMLGGSLMEMSTFRQNSDQYLYEQFIKLMPVLLGVFLIVLVELICSVTMNTRNQLKNYGIYFLCGCRWKDVLKISLANAGIIIGLGALLGMTGTVIFEFTPYAKLFEQNLDCNNVYLTFILILLMLMLSIVIPIFIIGKTQPVEIIKERT